MREKKVRTDIFYFFDLISAVLLCAKEKKNHRPTALFPPLCSHRRQFWRPLLNLAEKKLRTDFLHHIPHKMTAPLVPSASKSPGSEAKKNTDIPRQNSLGMDNYIFSSRAFNRCRFVRGIQDFKASPFCASGGVGWGGGLLQDNCGCSSSDGSARSSRSDSAAPRAWRLLQPVVCVKSGPPAARQQAARSIPKQTGSRTNVK